jgi:hypothetical protein
MMRWLNGGNTPPPSFTGNPPSLSSSFPTFLSKIHFCVSVHSCGLWQESLPSRSCPTSFIGHLSSLLHFFSPAVRESSLMVSDGSPLPTGGDNGMEGPSRHFLSGIYLERFCSAYHAWKCCASFPCKVLSYIRRKLPYTTGVMVRAEKFSCTAD